LYGTKLFLQGKEMIKYILNQSSNIILTLDKSEDGQVFVHINNKLTGTNIAYDCSISELKLLTEFILETIGEKK
jgi:FKBP-type peptidyl-prolyl cis-trans isomerase 2